MVADSAGKGKISEAPPPPLKSWYLLGLCGGGAEDNEPYGGISIKTQKNEYEKIRVSNANAWSIEKCATPKQLCRPVMQWLECHLSKWFVMSPQDYEHPLSHLFVEGYWFKTTNCKGTFEVDVKKLDLNACIHKVSPKHRLKSHFIRIGILHLNSPRKIELQ
jgi:hypothetical protein